MKIILKNAVKIARQMISHVVEPADIVVDATCGQGNDTLFLAELTGSGGLVYSFDIQESAIEAARSLLTKNNLIHTVRFIHDDHARLADYVHNKIKVCMFNLGYLPGGDHQITTKPDTTIKAVEASMKLLEVGGLVTIVAYPGHQAGKLELEELRKYLKSIPQQEMEITETLFINQINNPPVLIIAQKIKEEI